MKHFSCQKGCQFVTSFISVLYLLLSTSTLSIAAEPTQPGSLRYTIYSDTAIDSDGARLPISAVSVVAGDQSLISYDKPAIPKNLRGVVYSITAAEIFWDRAATPGQKYEVSRNGLLVMTTDGISYYDSTLVPGQTYQYSVVAINAAGNQSAPSSISVETGGNTLRQPENLRVSVYSLSATELFWLRQGPGQIFEVRRDGVLLGTTDGTSYYDNAVPGAGSYLYEVLAIDGSDGRSLPAQSTVTVDQMLPTPEAAITLANAGLILSGVIAIANGDSFEPVLELMHDASVRLRDAAFASLTNEPAPANGVTLVTGSDGGPSALSGLDGGMYNCDAGGEAALPAFLAFESGFGYVAEFDACQLLAGVFQGQYRRITPVPRSGNLGSEQLVDVYIEIDSDNIFSVAKLDAGTTTQFADRVHRTFALKVDRYVAQEGGDRTMIDSLSITRSSRIGTTFEDSNDTEQPPTFQEFRDASFTATFAVMAPFTSSTRFVIDMSLALDNSGIENPVDQWQSGAISVTASDGSTLVAEPIANNPQNLRLTVGDASLLLPWSEGYQVLCGSGFQLCNGE